MAAKPVVAQSCARARAKAQLAAAAQQRQRAQRELQRAAAQPPVSFPLLPAPAAATQLPTAFLRGAASAQALPLAGPAASAKTAAQQQNSSTDTLLTAVAAQLAERRRDDAARENYPSGVSPQQQQQEKTGLRPIRLAPPADQRRGATERELSLKHGVPELALAPSPAAATRPTIVAGELSSAARQQQQQQQQQQQPPARRLTAVRPGSVGAPAAASGAAAAARSAFNLGSSAAAGRRSVRTLSSGPGRALSPLRDEALTPELYASASSAQASLAHLPAGEAASPCAKSGAPSSGSAAVWRGKPPLGRSPSQEIAEAFCTRDSLERRRCAPRGCPCSVDSYCWCCCLKMVQTPEGSHGAEHACMHQQQPPILVL